MFDVKSSRSPIMRRGDVIATLTPVALYTLAKNAPSLLPDISEESIGDKSKADGFAKFIVCMQATWFIIQSVGRLTMRLPISLLEMNTLLHAFCCLLIYVAWWRKPLDIEEPYLIGITSHYVSKVCAWMMAKDRIHAHLTAYEDTHDGYSSLLSNHQFRLAYEEDLRDCDTSAALQRIRERVACCKRYNKRIGRKEEIETATYEPIQEQRSRNGESHLKCYPGQTTHGFVLYGVTNPINQPLYAKLPMSMVNCLRLAQSLRLEDGSAATWHFGDQSTVAHACEKMLTQDTSISNLLDPFYYLTDWRRPTWMLPESSLWMGLLFAGSVYGGFHALAWNAPFGTMIEQRLWQVSCLLITTPFNLLVFLLSGTMFGLVGYAFSCDFSRGLDEDSTSNGDVLSMIFSKMILGMLGIVTSLLVLAYPAARVYLVVECFVNLAYLPAEVFQEPDWSRYMPQFGSG
jgi:hypothetical protein